MHFSMYSAMRAIARRVSSALFTRVSPRLHTRYSSRMASRTSRLPITRMRFRGHAETLNAICRCLQEHPKQALTAIVLVEYTGLGFENVHQRLTETPELFIALPRKPDTTTRYRLTSPVERMDEAQTRDFIEKQTRSESRLATFVVSLIVAIAAIAGYLGAKY